MTLPWSAVLVEVMWYTVASSVFFAHCSVGVGLEPAEAKVEEAADNAMAPAAEAAEEEIPPEELDASQWETHVDDTTGHEYFYNAATGKSVWEKPQCLIDWEEQQAIVSRQQDNNDGFADGDSNGDSYGDLW